MLWDAPGVTLADDVLVGSFLLFVTIVVLHAVLSAANVTWEVVNGALCVYLLPRSLAVRRSQPFASRERVLSRSSTMGERPRR
jgi:hypothetical protein